MTRKSVLLAVLVLLVAAGVIAAAGEAADTAAAAPPAAVAVETQEKPVASSIAPVEPPFFSWAYWQEGGTDTSRSEVFRNGGLFLAALFGLGFAFWRARIATIQAEAAAARADAAIDQARAANEQARAANEQARIAEQGHITERFSRAVEHLGHDRVAVRIGGLYALKRIAEDSVERDHLAVMDVLTNFVRRPPYADAQRVAAEQGRELRAYKTITGGAPGGPPPEPELIDCPDIVAAIEIIQGRSEDQKAVEEKREYRLSLSRASLSYLRLPEVDLQYFDLAGADLTGAELTRVKLLGANLVRAKLLGANLVDANLLEANLTGADLTDTDLTDANLTDTDLTDANLTAAILTAAKLKDTDLSGANLTGAKLMFANITDADLMAANLRGADLTDADFTRATNLTQQQLNSAHCDPNNPPKLPAGLMPPETPPEPSAEDAAPPPPEAL